MHSSVQHLRCAGEAEVPAIYYPLFFGITGAVQGLNLRQVMERARRQFLALQMRNWAFWLPAQYFQFVFLPIEKQVLFTCIAGLVWNIILSALAGSARSRDSTVSLEMPSKETPPSWPGHVRRGTWRAICAS